MRWVVRRLRVHSLPVDLADRAKTTCMRYPSVVLPAVVQLRYVYSLVFVGTEPTPRFVSKRTHLGAEGSTGNSFSQHAYRGPGADVDELCRIFVPYTQTNSTEIQQLRPDQTRHAVLLVVADIVDFAVADHRWCRRRTCRRIWVVKIRARSQVAAHAICPFVRHFRFMNGSYSPGSCLATMRTERYSRIAHGSTRGFTLQRVCFLWVQIAHSIVSVSW